MGDYYYITIEDPRTGKCVNLHTPKGMEILNNYIEKSGLNPPIASIKLPDTGYTPNRKSNYNPSEREKRRKERNRRKEGLHQVIREAWPETKSKKKPKTDDRIATEVNRVNNKNPFRYYDSVIPIDECEKQSERPEGLPAVKLAWGAESKGPKALQALRDALEALHNARKNATVHL